MKSTANIILTFIIFLLNLSITSEKIESKRFFSLIEEENLTKETILKDEIILNPEVVYRAGFTTSDQAFFRIKLENKNINLLNIYLTVLSGNADIYIYSDNEHKNLLQKKNFRYAYKKEIIEISEDFLENYYISIILHEPSYIEIKYDINMNEKQFILLNNEVNIEYLNKEQDYKKFSIKSESENNYLLIKSLDCSLTYQNGETEDKNITYRYYEFSGKEYNFNLKLENYFHTIPNDKEDCTIFINTGTFSNSENNPLLIHENIPISSSFNNSYYNFPFFYDDSFKGIFAKFVLEPESIMDSNPEVKITFILGDQKSDYESYIIHKSKLFFIKSNAKKYCKNKQSCNLLIQIEKQQTSSQNNDFIIDTTIKLLSSSSPIFINKNQVYNEKILSLGSKYFYTELDENEEGEINIMFNKGSGQIFAKIVEKNIFEENPNWNRRIILPEENSENLLEFDSIRGSLKYYSKSYNNCNNGCELYILVKGNETAENEMENAFNEFSFSIDKKRNDIGENGVINLLINNYVKGNMTKNVYKYYTFTINFDIKKISINFYTIYGRLYIKLGKGHIANEKNHDWELIRRSEGHNRLIISCNDEKIGKNSLKNLSFSLGIILSDTYIDENSINTYYFLQVQTLHNDMIDYYYLQSERSIICNTNEYEYCYILLPLSEINNNQNSVIYASSLTNDENKINILSKSYTEDEIDNISFTQKMYDKFPTQRNCEQNSDGEKYLLLDNNKINKNNYIFLTIDANEKNNLIKIILSPPSNIIKTSLPPFTERLIYINYNKAINFTILDNRHPSPNFSLNIKTLSGMPELFLGEKDYYSEIDGNYINEISPDFENPMKINNINKNKEESIILISYKQRGNDFDLIKNINNEICFSLTNDPFPNSGFIDMKNKSIKINYYLYDIQYERGGVSALISNLFNIYAMLIPDDGDTFDVPGNYLIYENLGVIDLKLNNGEIKDGGYFVYSFIEKSYGNFNEYKKIKEQITVSELNENNEIKIYPKVKYFYSLNNNDTIVNLILKNKINDNKIFLIDIAQDMPALYDFDYTFKANNNENLEIDEINEDMGKKRIIIDLSKTKNDNNDIKLDIEKKGNNSNWVNFTLIYCTYESKNLIENYKKFDNSFYVQENKGLKKIIFKNIQYYYKDSISNVIYFINIFNKTENRNTYNDINTVFLGNNDKKNMTSSIIDWLGENYENYTYIFNDTMNKTEYLYRVVVSFINKKGMEERIVYKFKEEENSSSGSNALKIFLYIFIPILIIVIIIIVTLYLKNKTSNKGEKINKAEIEPIVNLEDSKNEDLIDENKK